MKTNAPQQSSFPDHTHAPSHTPPIPPRAAPEINPNPARRNGKIARLPREIRNQINQLLSDGTPYAAIAKEIAAKGHRLNDSNISRWFSGGYQDWLKEQACLDEMRARLDFASEFVNQHNSQLLDQASLRIAVLRLYNLFTDFDPAVLKPKLVDHPGTYARLLNALCKLTESDLKFERHRRNQDRQPPLAQSTSVPNLFTQ